MQIDITTNEKNKKVVTQLTHRLPSETPENIIARIALAYSLQTGEKFSLEKYSLYDSNGKSYKQSTLLGDYGDFYIALICQHYEIRKTDENIKKYFKFHIDHGLEEMGKEILEGGDDIFEFLNEKIEDGLRDLDDKEFFGYVENKHQNVKKSYYSQLIKVEVGKDINDKPILLELNNKKIYNSCHIAVAGTTGSGKTQFALSLISQITKQSNFGVNYIYLDFKGLKNSDESMKRFFENTKTNFIDIPKTHFPINPLTFIDNVNKKYKESGIDRFVSIICDYSKSLGHKQRDTLRRAIKQAFEETKIGSYPTIKEINEIIQAENKPDSLTSIIDALSRHHIFSNDSNIPEDFLNKNHYLSLSGDLPDEIRFVSLFLVINYIHNTFMNMEDAPVKNDVQSLRYVVLIDEAHAVFGQKKYHGLLEKMLRQIRSKGVAIVLLSQGMTEFNQKDFDFSSLCEISFLLDIKEKNRKFMEIFLGFSPNSKESNKMMRSMEKIAKGQAISNIKEFGEGELFKVGQYYE